MTPLEAAQIAAAPFILALLADSAVFSAAETALTGASLQAPAPALGGGATPPPCCVSRLLSDQETMISAVPIGYNVLNILGSALATEFITRVVPRACRAWPSPP